jgi:hypothetical protein
MCAPSAARRFSSLVGFGPTYERSRMPSGTQTRQLFYGVLIAGLCLVALIAIVGFLSGDFGETDARILATTFAVVVYSATSLAGLTLIGRGKAAVFAFLAIGASIAGFIAAMAFIWSESPSDSDGTWKAEFMFLVVALAAADAALLILRQRQTDAPAVEALVVCTIGAMAVLASMTVMAILKELEDEGYYRFLAVIAVLWMLGTFLIPIVRKASQGSPGKETPEQRSS